MPSTLCLSKLVDLALGTPEVGAVNFNVLHTLLHAMLQKLNIQEVLADIDDSDRDFLSSSKQRVMSTLSDKDSGKGEDLEDTSSENRSSEAGSPISSSKSKVKRSVPYHNLELRVERLAEQLEELNALPSNSELFERAKAKGDGERPIADMWQYMQMKKRVDANEDGVGKLMSLVEDLMKEMQVLRNANNELQDKLNNLNLDELRKKLADLENTTNELNNKFSLLPTPEEFSQFVTWPGLEDALKGVRTDLENLQSATPAERVVIEIGSQTDPPSRPHSSRPASRATSRVSVASSGPSSELLDVLERLGKLSDDHDTLKERVDDLEEQMKNKLEKDALEGLMQQMSALSSSGSEPVTVIMPQIQRVEVISTWSQTAPVEPPPPPVQTVELVTQPILVKSVEPAPDKSVVPVIQVSTQDISEDLLAQLNKLREDLDALQHTREKDSDALSRAQRAILQLQAELEKLQNTTEEIIEENKERTKQIENLLQYCDSLQEKKADKEYVAMEVDVKADKRQLEKKVNHSLFDNTTSEINRLIKEILDKLAGSEDSWKDAYNQLANDLDGKLDRLELDPLKEWLESRLKALNKKIMQSGTDWGDDDAAGLRKQLLQRFNCLSCDRPIDLMPTGPVPTLPTQNGLPPTRSPRPYTTYELDQIRQHARSFNNPEISDYYATTRQCGGNHTLTYPHKRIARMTHLNSLFKEDEAPQPQQVLPIYKEEVDVQGVDGHIYKGRVERLQLEAKMPTTMNVPPSSQNQKSPGIQRHVASPRLANYGEGGTIVHPPSSQPFGGRGTRPMSARGTPSPRPTSRPQSARPMSAKLSVESSQTTPQPDEPNITPHPDVGDEQGQITVETEAIRVEVPTPNEGEDN